MIRVSVYNMGLLYLEYDPETVTVTGLKDDEDVTKSDFDLIEEALSAASSNFPYQPEAWYTFEMQRIEDGEPGGPSFKVTSIYAYSGEKGRRQW